MKPNFIGIGVQKCATAWLFNILQEHPQIVMAKTTDGMKDTQFFNNFYDRGFEWYEKHFSAGTNQICGEYSTSYFYDPEAPRRIFEYDPNVKLIVSLRHPVERAFSNHKHEIKLQRISGENIFFENGIQNNPMYLSQSLYYTHLSKWLQYFKKDQIFVLLVENIQKNSSKLVEDLYSFLGVDSAYRPSMLTQRIHETTLPKNATVESYKKIFSDRLKKLHMDWMIHFFKRVGAKGAIDRLNTQKARSSFPPMKHETREYLLEYFQEENRKLSELLQLDLSNWDR